MTITRLPETLGIYESMLDMSICRGDLPAAKLAFRAISSFSKYPVDTLSSVLIRASLLHFSVLPSEIIRVDMSDAWEIISGMCEASLDKRAYTIASFFINGVNTPLVHDFVRFSYSESGTCAIPLSTYMDRLLYKVVVSMNRVISDNKYFQFSSVPLTDVDDISSISTEYYLGSKSWIYNHIINYITVISNLSHREAEQALSIFEHNYTTKLIQYKLDYWDTLKQNIFKNTDVENLWNASLRKKVLSRTTEILETRLPIQMPG